MTTFQMVKYHKQEYPNNIPINIEECAAHIDITSINSSLKTSLHTEYSYGKRKFNSSLIRNFPLLIESHKDFIPQLWYSNEWSKQFADFVISLANNKSPCVIEIHPPFSDYSSMEVFIESYKVFEAKISENFPDTDILIENRCGSIYKGGKFVISKTEDIEQLVEQIEKYNLRLKIAYDIPQIYTAHNIKKQSSYIEILQKATSFRQYIGGVHLWGKRRAESGRLVSHCGDLNSYFENDKETKELFLNQFISCFDDDISRKMVLEVNSGNEDLTSIVKDLLDFGTKFI